MAFMPSQLIAEILQLNQERAKEFRENQPARRAFRERHPVEIAVTMCMDGRVGFSAFADIPFGITNRLRNIGGKYDIGWPMMRATLNDIEEYANSERRATMLVITYHFSSSDSHLGCKGFGYDTVGAVGYMERFRAEVKRVYGRRIYPVVVGIETDCGAFVIHGENGERLETRTIPEPMVVASKIHALFPFAPESIFNVLVEIVNGNVAYQKSQPTCPPEDLDHRERVLAIGQGFDWYYSRNSALIIGPCDPALDKAIAVAATIIKTNRDTGRIPKDARGVLLVSTPFRRLIDRSGAEEQTRFLRDFALSVIASDLPEMSDFFEPLAGVLDLRTREFHPLKAE